MAPVAVEIEQPRDIYVGQAETFLHGVEEYEVDFEQLRLFCNYYPQGDSLKEEREQLTRAVEDFDYEQISAQLIAMIAKIKEDRMGGQIDG